MEKVQGLLLFLFAFSVVIGVTLHSTTAISEKLAQASNTKPLIVIVPGGCFDGTLWQHVISLLQFDDSGRSCY